MSDMAYEHHPDERSIEEVEQEIADRNPDPETRREAFEREAAERGRSEEATEVADDTDGPVPPDKDIVEAG